MPPLPFTTIADHHRDLRRRSPSADTRADFARTSSLVGVASKLHTEDTIIQWWGLHHQMELRLVVLPHQATGSGY